jgi:hypothetical protein
MRQKCAVFEFSRARVGVGLMRGLPAVPLCLLPPLLLVAPLDRGLDGRTKVDLNKTSVFR